MDKFPKIIFIMGMLLLFPLFSTDGFCQTNSEHQFSIASRNPGMFQNQIILSSGRESYTNSEENASYKSEETAFFLALFPGCFIHGLGHYYAGDYLTGSILLGLEILSLSLIIEYGASSALGNGEIENEFVTHSLLTASIIAFLGGWIYDILFVDNAVERHNNKIRAQISLPSDQHRGIKLSLGFSF
ncbi:MAG: hypothetical protein GF310_13685 [candidate division Zixibacteria bacterium]|nr:hypothetical protein [candidate division Zixibacteria bacterium]